MRLWTSSSEKTFFCSLGQVHRMWPLHYRVSCNERRLYHVGESRGQKLGCRQELTEASPKTHGLSLGRSASSAYVLYVFSVLWMNKDAVIQTVNLKINELKPGDNKAFSTKLFSTLR